MAGLVCAAQEYSFSTTTAGLGNLNVNCMVQDQSGYLWVGTENGLYRYDGRGFREFGAADGLRGHVIQSLFVAPDGTLLAGTTTGIFFERGDGEFGEIHPPAPVTDFSQRIGTVFAAMADGRVVTADRSGAFLLRKIEQDHWTAERMELEGERVWSVMTAPDGTLWYGCDDDLCTLKDGKTTHLRESLGMPAEAWLHLKLARDGHVWVRGAMRVGEVIPGEDRWVEHPLPGSSNAAPYGELAEDVHGHMAATQGAAFGLWEDGRWRMVTAANGLPRYDISEMFVDREGSIWLGVVGHGLMRWVGQDRWEGYTQADGLSDDIVWATLRDRTGRLWIGTESGLDMLDAGSTTPRVWRQAGILTARSASLAEAPDGAVWMGSAAGNLVRIDERTLAGRQWKVPEVFRVVCDGSGVVWAATDGGLYRVEAGTGDRAPQPVEVDEAHPRLRFTDLALDDKKQLWAATDRGIYRMDGTGWHAIDPGLAGLTPTEIAADGGGIVWGAGAFPGVVRLRISGDRVVDTEHVSQPHLPSEQVVSLLVDNRGWVWVGQDAGLSVFDGKIWRSYTRDDGLIWNDTDSYALAEDRDGSLWIGTSGGLSHFETPKAQAQGAPPAPVFSEMEFGKETLHAGARIEWSASPLSISVATLTYKDASHVHIRYRLLGLETDWVETADRSARYPRLDPGAYKFQALAVDTASGAVSPIAEVSFVVLPQWWQSRPLRLAVVLAIALLVVLTWRWSVHLLVTQKRNLERAVQRRTEDLEREKGELMRAREQMRHYAEHDDLTGLWNHRIIIERLRQEVDRSRRERSPVSVILVDLDHFKQVNDTCGHPSGDLVLKEVAAVLQRMVRSYDWVGRYGGEEFLLILPGSGFDGARMRAEDLRAAVASASIHDGEQAIPITASFGVASGFTTDFEVLIRAADAALYRAKANGRNCVVASEIEPERGAEGSRESEV